MYIGNDTIDGCLQYRSTVRLFISPVYFIVDLNQNVRCTAALPKCTLTRGNRFSQITLRKDVSSYRCDGAPYGIVQSAPNILLPVRSAVGDNHCCANLLSNPGEAFFEVVQLRQTGQKAEQITIRLSGWRRVFFEINLVRAAPLDVVVLSKHRVQSIGKSAVSVFGERLQPLAPGRGLRQIVVNAALK